MKLDAFGRKLDVVRENELSVVYQLGEGKRTRSNDFLIPGEYTEDEAILFLEDLLHKVATSQSPRIKRLE